MTVNSQQNMALANARTQKLLERVPGLAWLMTERGEVCAANQRWREYIGACDVNNCAHVGVVSANNDPCVWIWTELLHESDRDSFEIAWNAAKIAQEPLQVKISLQSIAGDWQQFEVDLEPDDRGLWIGTAIEIETRTACRLRQQSLWSDRANANIDTSGEIRTDERGHRRLSGLVYDITERQRDESALRRSEELTRRILESSKDCIKVLDLEGRLLYMNDGGQVLMEIEDFNTVANARWATFWQGSDGDRAQLALAEAKAGKIGKFEGYCATVQGTPKWWEVVVTPILDLNGSVEKILSVSRDITERRQTTLALQASEELFRYNFEHIPIGLAHVNLDGRLFRVNQKFCEIVGYSQEELLATTFQAITEPEDLAEDLELVARLVSGELTEYTLEKRYIHKQGDRVWVNLTVSLAREPAPAGTLGAPKYFLAAIKNITERKELELRTRQQTTALQQLNSSLLLVQQRLKDRNEQLDRFVYVASHDLKAPLRAIANLAQWIEDDHGKLLPEDAIEQFNLLRQRVKRMDALIDGLLQYSRVGKEDLPSQPIDIAQLVAETIDSLSPPPHFQIEIASPLPTLNTSPMLLQQVFANLLSNAIKHNDKAEGSIAIAAEDLGDSYRFSIADNGAGIPPGEARNRIFEIFHTLRPSSSSENTGIGLAIVKKIVEGQGGRVWIDDSVSPGACFCFTWIKG